jgi:hypothetical protein
VLVVVSGAVGTSGNDFVEVAGATASIEVIDAETLELVGTYPLGNAALSGVSALNAENAVLVIGSAIDRWLFSVDLEPLLDPLFPSGSTPADLGGWVRYDRGVPFAITLDSPVDTGTCLGLISGMAISDDLSEIYAVDFCSGTLTVVEAASDGILMQGTQIELTAPINEPDPDPGSEEVVLKGPGRIAVRPGTPGTSFAGSDLFVLVSQPEGGVCAQNVLAN